MENVFVAPKRNINGYRYGFVRFSKVRDVTKLLHAVNNVSFGNYRIWAKVASFDRAYGKGEERRLKVGEAFVDEGARDKGAKMGRNRVGNNGEGEKSVR
ncbi:RNA recognition motif, partial [Trifolium medium]|nr:RNA recognition motif [Trifolium medium]